MILTPEDIIKLLLAILIGGIIGAEREFHEKAAGFRTIIVICVGATLFTIFSRTIGGPDDPARIAANIVSGVGFLGAGVIFRHAGEVSGLTTASTIWLAAAMGMGIGGGEYLLTGIAVAVTLIVLAIFPKLEGLMKKKGRQVRTYELLIPATEPVCDRITDIFREQKLDIQSVKHDKRKEMIVCTISALGAGDMHDRLVKVLMMEKEVRQFSY
jgi:putative Mg2+ transporter-C (MgtC) family protein